jgi:hypothetical protein
MKVQQVLIASVGALAIVATPIPEEHALVNKLVNLDGLAITLSY